MDIRLFAERSSEICYLIEAGFVIDFYGINLESYGPEPFKIYGAHKIHFYACWFASNQITPSLSYFSIIDYQEYR